MTLDVDVGLSCVRGRRKRNDDYAAALRADDHEAERGLIAAVADGVSAGDFGYEAAQTAVLTLVQDYFSAPDTWDTTVVLDRLLSSHNAWLAGINRRREHGAAMTTLTALVLQGHGWTLAHVGDSRAWLLRRGELTQLTADHALEHPDFAGQLTRAMGLDDVVRIDYSQGDLHVGDTLILTTDGVHGVLTRRQIAALANADESAAVTSRAIVRAALTAGSRDNATALVLRVMGLDAERLGDAMRRARQLPVPGPLKAGDRLDGFGIEAVAVDNGVHRILRARDPASGAKVALKTLSTSRAADPEERAMLAHEAWLTSRVGGILGPSADDNDAGRGFVRVHEVIEPSAFYTVYDWVDGSTLEQLLADGRRFGVAEVVSGAVQIARALGRLHRLGVVHRDLKPANLHLGDDGRWRIFDLGAALSGNEPAVQRGLRAGTPSYMNPEQWGDEEGAHAWPADAASDLFGLGVTLYRWLTGRLPYGEVEPYQRSRFRRDPVSPSRLRPDVPMWLDHVVLRAIALGPALRFTTAEELVLALDRGAARPLPAPPPTPLATRQPLGLWKAALGLSVLLNVLLVIWLLWLPRR